MKSWLQMTSKTKGKKKNSDNNEGSRCDVGEEKKRRGKERRGKKRKEEERMFSWK